VAIAGCDGYVRAVGLHDGEEKASASVGGNFAVAPAYASGAVFVGSMDGEYASVRLSDGHILWKTMVRKNGGASYGSAAVSGNSVVFPSRNHTVFCLNRTTGQTQAIASFLGPMMGRSAPWILQPATACGSSTPAHASWHLPPSDAGVWSSAPPMGQSIASASDLVIVAIAVHAARSSSRARHGRTWSDNEKTGVNQ